MKNLERIPGYYWVCLKLRNKWTVAEYDKDGHWWFIGNDGFEDLEEGDFVGEIIVRNKPESPAALEDAVVPCLMLSDFLDLNRFKVFEDKTKIIFRVPIDVIQIVLTGNEDLMNTLFKRVSVEQNAPNINIQIVTCYKHEF